MSAARLTATRLPLSRAALFAVTAGALAALGFEPWNLWPLTLIGIAVLVALVDTARGARAAALLGWLFGVGHFCVALAWIATAFTFQAKMPAWLGWVAVVGLSMFLAFYIAFAAGLARALARGSVARVLVLAAAWMLAEWLRGWVLSGFAWDPLGVAWIEVSGIRQLASLFGGLGLSGLVMLAAGGLWLVVRPSASAVTRWTGAALVVAVAGAGLVGTRFDHGGSATGNPQVFVVQPDIGQDQKYVEGSDAAHLQTYLDLTAAALAAARPPGSSPRGALVVWSESSVPYAVEEDPEVRARLAAVLGPGDLLLFGGVAVIRDGRGAVTSLTNSLFVLDAAGRLHGRYDKAHLVPLGEYVPARPWMEALGLARLTPGDLDFRPGPGPRTLALPGFPPAGVQICYEIIFPGTVVDAAHRPAWIANISNDAWFGPSGPPQHLAQARLRAIEEGLPIARATPTGISAIVDGHGRLVAAQPPGTVGVISAPLPAALPPTLFARHGHATSAVFGLLLLVAGLAFDRRRQ